MIRLRFVYQKIGNIKFTSTLDMQKIWERSCRRAALKLAYSQGFHPQAKIQQAAPLPLGIEGLAEIVDVWFNEDWIPMDLIENINHALPMGLEVKSFTNVELSEPSLQNRVYASIYSILQINYPSRNYLEENIRKVLSSQELIVERNRRRINLRERINDIMLVQADDEGAVEIKMNLKQLPGLTGRPEDVLATIGVDANKTRIMRIQILYR